MFKRFELLMDGQVYGPYKLDELEDMMHAGNVSNQSQFRRVNSEQWRPIQEVILEIPKRKEPISKTEELAGCLMLLIKIIVIPIILFWIGVMIFTAFGGVK